MLGLAFERAELAVVGTDYLDSATAADICAAVALCIVHQAAREHQYYRCGEAAFADKAISENQGALEKARALFGEKYKKVRYHHLVRLGADIQNSPLGEFPKATILGGLLTFAKQAKH